MSDSDAWLQLTIHVADAARWGRQVETALQQCVDSVQVQTHDTMDGAGLDPASVRLVAYTAADDSARVARIRAALDHLGADDGVSMVVAPYADTSWRDGWKAFFQPAIVSPRLAIRAPWAEIETPAGVETLVIEPGGAFGTGLHETTRLCLEVIDRVAVIAPPRSLLDVGTGSGVLAIGAAKLGVRRCVGIDNDPVCAEVAPENAALNGVTATCAFATQALGDVAESHDLVVANILSHVLLLLRHELTSHVAEGGRLVLSGLLADELPRFEPAFVAETAFFVERRHTLGPWACIELIREG